jgi:hypothetical protein
MNILNNLIFLLHYFLLVTNIHNYCGYIDEKGRQLF